ncbi:MAG TPA: condensation domain-containing protein [Vicinamibacterales bacterium]|nr:condensation domain-containing protein [Vicinamibacterales bacterium]
MPELVDTVPLSFSERLMWQTECARLDGVPFIDCASNLLIGARIRGRLDVRALRRSVSAIVERHDVLRSTVRELDGQPCRIVGPVTGDECQCIDLRDCPLEVRTAGEARIIKQELGKAINLRVGPLFRAILITVADHEHVFACIVHHLVFDGWSKAVFARELKSAYEAYSSGRVPELPLLPLQHADYVRWQQSRFSDERVDTAAMAMAARLSQASANALTGACRSGARGAATRTLWIDAERTEALRRASGAHGVTLAVLLLSVFVTLLRRATGHNDVLVGVPLSDRRRPDFQGLIGLFVDVAVARMDGVASTDFGETVRHVRERLREAYAAHQAVPYGSFLRWAHQRSVHTPNLRFLFSFHNDVPGAEIELPGLVTEDLGVVAGRQQALADLSLLIAWRQGGLKCVLSATHATGLADDVDRCVEWFDAVVSSLDDRRVLTCQ